MAESPPILDYSDGRFTSELAVDVLPDGGVAITVPTRRSAGRLAWELATADFWTVILLPLIYPTVWAFFQFFGSKAPRAVVRLTRDEFTLVETSDHGFGWRPDFRAWPRAMIAELRPNRYQPTLWLRVSGEVQCDLLEGLPPEWIHEIGKALAQAQTRLGPLT